MDMSATGPTPLEVALGWLFLIGCLAGPVGLIALRHHFSEARGGLLAVKNVMVFATVVSSPVLFGVALVVVLGVAEAFATLWGLLWSAW